jgi:hypothetical protein
MVVFGLGQEPTTKPSQGFDLTWHAALEDGGVLPGEEATITLDLWFVRS